jgi:predicted transcriptional regulator of viral defense system
MEKERGLSKNQRNLLSQLTREGAVTIDATRIQNLSGVSRAQAQLQLSRLYQKGWLRRLKPGVYGLVDLAAGAQATPEDPKVLAMHLFSPCYISGWSSAEHWDLTEQIFNTIVVFTRRPKRKIEHDASGIRFHLHQTKEADFFGVEKMWLGTTPVFIADPHRTLIDVLHFPALGGGGRLVTQICKAYFASPHKDWNRLLDYARRIGRGSVAKRLGFLASCFDRPPAEWTTDLHRLKTQGITRLDPQVPLRGRINSEWNLGVNVPPDDLR